MNLCGGVVTSIGTCTSTVFVFNFLLLACACRIGQVLESRPSDLLSRCEEVACQNSKTYSCDTWLEHEL